MKKMLAMLFVLCGVAVQVDAMSRPTYGKNSVGVQNILNQLELFKQIRDEDYERGLAKLIQQRDESYTDIERLARVLSSNGSAKDISAVIKRAQKQHGIDIWWLDPVEYQLVAEQCTGKKACDDPAILDKPQQYCQRRLRELADANNEVYSAILKKIELYQSSAFKKAYIQNNDPLVTLGTTPKFYQNRMNRE